MGGVSMEWKEVDICQLCDSVSETYKGNASEVVLINTSDVLDGKCLNHEYVPNKKLKGQFKKTFRKGDILYSEIRPANKRFCFVDFEPKDYIASTKLMVLRAHEDVDPQYLYQILRSNDTLAQLQMLAESRSGTFPQITYSELSNIMVSLPSQKAQKNIVSILSSLDRKIELNNKINADLEEMAQAIFKNWFVDFEPFKDGKFVDSELGMIPKGWKVGRADDYYQINIGKTPPRKEHKWFSTNPADKIWVSIANMGNSGIFISDSSEYLTQEAVDSHNIIMVPRNTILLSFKLTVGRVAIADKELTTNEAIARFILSDDKYMEYLYLYLKKFDYNSLGSTSSIATAVNSKTIKGMQMLQPSDKVIDAFHIQVNPIFEKIRSLTKENSRLSLLRDTLLPRLMSGELEVPE